MSKISVKGVDLDNKESIKKNYKKVLEYTNQYISLSIQTKIESKMQEYRLAAIELLEKFTSILNPTDYLLIDSKPEISENIYYESFFTLGTLYKSYVETENQKEIQLRQQNELNRNGSIKKFSIELESMFKRAINHFVMILRVKFQDPNTLKQIISIYTQLSLLAPDFESCLNYLQEALLYEPNNPTIHYNLGFVYLRLNKIELSLIHYKISLGLSENKKCSEEEKLDNKKLIINNYNGISSIYCFLKQWPEALYYLLLAEKVDNSNPDIQNQLGVVYTEMRRTDLAEIAYNRAIKNYDSAFISTDKKFLLSELYLNLGHMHSYNGDNHKSVENYNKSLKVCPKFNLPFQNKIMNLTYLFNELEDKMYITNQHKLVNKLYEKGNGRFVFSKDFYKTDKINIGIISGDYTDHPVSFFINTFLQNFDKTRFNVTCYSECYLNTSVYSSNLCFKTIKNLSISAAANMIYNDKTHILFDLSGHTAFNRLDIFALKPSPIQITYIGYPFTTGLTEMDYRITDNICDGDLEVSQKFYTEKLLPMKNCFLCYDPTLIRNTGQKLVPKNTINIRKRDGFINIGCFNRVNKITHGVIKTLNDILVKIPKTRLILKTKALINKKVRSDFINKFDKPVRDRIIVLECTISHEDHLLTYNQVDIAIDTFPYSGTTTTCEALYMGVPVYSFYDSKYYFHAQNVSCSILQNSNLSEYILKDTSEIIQHIQKLMDNVDVESFWLNLKRDVQQKFTNGLVCNKTEYMKNFQEMLINLYQEKL
jgi:predicted O-linked N-acetylglucosamine transferase (SPINDLY family)